MSWRSWTMGSSAWLLALGLAGPPALLGLPSRQAGGSLVRRATTQSAKPQAQPTGEGLAPAQQPAAEEPASGAGGAPAQAAGSAQEPAAAGQELPAQVPQDEPPPAPLPDASAQGTTEVPEVPEVIGPVLAEPLPEVAFPAYVPRYRSLAESDALLAELAAASGGRAHPFELGRTLDGRPVMGLEFGAAGEPAQVERPAVFLLGGLDGRSLCGAEAVLASAHHLLSGAGGLPSGITFVAVPWVSADALSWTLDPGAARPALDGRNGRPTDDDRDGLVDEDGPDDLDGDGLVLDMLVEDPSGPWARGGDGRFLVPAAPGTGARFLLTREGRDDDGDGLFNEDPIGGVVLDVNFPVNRLGPWDDPRTGRVAMSEPLSRALADRILAQHAALVVLFQGNHGCLAVPGGVAGGEVDVGSDLALFERVTESFLAATGRQQAGVLSLAQARGGPSPGAAIDWMHAVAGALAIEVAPWGPRVEGQGPPGVALRDARYPVDGRASLDSRERGMPARAFEERGLLGSTESAWASWLDNTRGGLGFVDWQPVDLERGRKGWVGGFEPRTIQDPPEDSLARALEGLAAFSAQLAQSLPLVEIELTEVAREGDLLRLGARVHNRGRLPTGLAGTGVRLVLEPPSGGTLVAGSETVLLPRLSGGELSREVSWVLVTPPDSTARLVARADWAASAVREVRR